MRVADQYLVLINFFLCVCGNYYEISNNVEAKNHSLELTQSLNLARQELIQDTCTRFPPRWTLDDLPVNRLEHILIDEHRKLLYCYVPKVSFQGKLLWCLLKLV